MPADRNSTMRPWPEPPRAHPERYVPAHLLHDVLHAARQARDHKATRCLIHEMPRRRLLAGDNPPLPRAGVDRHP